MEAIDPLYLGIWRTVYILHNSKFFVYVNLISVQITSILLLRTLFCLKMVVFVSLGNKISVCHFHLYPYEELYNLVLRFYDHSDLD